MNDYSQTVEQVRETLISMMGYDTPTSMFTVDLMSELWRKWLTFKHEEAPQKYYIGLSALKQYMDLWTRIDPETKKTRRNDPLSKNLKIHAAKQLDDADDLQQFLPAKKQA